jgi:exodeoxyribonuclease V alpha subunit
VLKDLIQCGKINVARLNDIFRQKADSSIISIAHSILAGKVTLPARSSNLEKIDLSNDINFVEASSPEQCVSFITELCKKTLPNALGLNAIKDIQIISPMHRGTAGTQNINAELQKSLNPRREQLIAAGKVFKVGDKIIQMRNNYDKNVFNGDMGLITAIDTVNFSLHANFENQTYEFTREDINDIQLAYCISVHKSQGSEYPTVIIPLLKQHYMMLQRNLIYTAITRGKRKVVIVGEVEAYALAVSNSKSKFRQTDLLNKISNH